MKVSFLKRLIYIYQFALDYPLYWKMRIALQYTPHNKWGGGKKAIAYVVVQKDGSKEMLINGNWITR